MTTLNALQSSHERAYRKVTGSAEFREDSDGSHYLVGRDPFSGQFERNYSRRIRAVTLDLLETYSRSDASVVADCVGRMADWIRHNAYGAHSRSCLPFTLSTKDSQIVAMFLRSTE
jgi:hypothetical protein